MIAILDAAYGDECSAAACVLATSWQDDKGASEHTITRNEAWPYEPGQFYKRELPLLLAVMPTDATITFAVVDGYAWLGPERTAGLGEHLYDATLRRFPVIGVAKTAFAQTAAAEVLRGKSQRPLYVTCAGVDLVTAAALIRQMQGPARLPTLIKRADELARLALGSR